jgi:hypothetical protein
MQSSDKGKFDNLTLIGRLNLTRNRAVSFQCPVGSMAVIVGGRSPPSPCLLVNRGWLRSITSVCRTPVPFFPHRTRLPATRSGNTTLAMNRAAIFIFAFGAFVCSGYSETARLFQPHPTCFDLAVVANRFTSLGKDGAIAELTRTWRTGNGDLLEQENKREQIGWVCRLIFVPKPGKVIRRPLFGGQGETLDELRDVEWPCYPLVESKGVFFLLAEGYELAGIPEDPIEYLAYCSANGVFRDHLLEVPTEESAARALEHLFASESWKKIVWKGGIPIGSDFADLKRYLIDQTKKSAKQSRCRLPPRSLG